MPISTIPITSDKRLGSKAWALAFGLVLAGASLFLLWRSSADLIALRAAESGAEALSGAMAMEAGLARDAQLDLAQNALQQALSRHPEDGLSWSRLAEVRVLQATGSAVSSISPALLQASIDAGLRAAALGRDGATDLARQAFALSLLAGQQRGAATALAASYAREPLGAGLAMRRLPAAQRVWAELNAEARAAALREACSSREDPLDQGAHGEALLQRALAGPEDAGSFCRRAGFASPS